MEYELAIDSVREKYGALQNAPKSDPQVQDCKRKMLKFRPKKEFYRSQMRLQLREEYFEQKNTMLIEAQLDKTGAKFPTPEPPVPWIPPMPERAELASLVTSVNMRSPDMLDSRTRRCPSHGELVQPRRSCQRIFHQARSHETRMPLPGRCRGPCGSR